MADQKLLAVFEVEIDKKPTRFSIYGDYSIETGTDYNNNKFKYPEFNDLAAYQIIDGKEVRYTPQGATWAGRKFIVDDMIQDYIASLIISGPLYTKIYLESKLDNLVSEYTKDENIAITLNDLKIPKQILSNNMYYLYELVCVTNEFIYYTYYDEMIMYRVSDHSIVSDNYFASVGYNDSLENIEKGEEELLWGEIPEEA